MSGPDPVRELTCDEVREMAGAFVLGALEPAEAAAVRAHLAHDGDAHPEIAELGSVLPVLAASVPTVEPPADLKARIMAAAAADLASRRAGEAPAASAATGAPTLPAAPPESGAAIPPAAPSATAADAEPTPFPGASERAARRQRTSIGVWAARIAAVLVIVLLGGWNLVLQGQLNTAQDYEDSVAAVLDVAAQPGSKTAILNAATGTGSGLAAISASGEMTLAMQDLAPTTGDTVYTAWSIGGDKVPVPIGDFKVGSSGTASFVAPGVPAVDGLVLALTHEPAPGATTPTLPIISDGVTTSAG